MSCQAKLIVSLFILAAVFANPTQKWGNHGPCSAMPLRISSTPDTHYASNHGTPPPSDSCTSDSQSGAWWGSFLVPSGTVVNFSTCEASTANFDTVVSIYSGPSCIKLSCEATFTNGSTCTHFTWTSTGSQLFVAVQGVGTQSGDFGLTTQIVTQTDATCSAPIKLQIQPIGVQQFSGSLEYGSVTAPPACEYYWYWDDADATFAGTTVVWYEITTLEHALVHFEASSACVGAGTVLLQVSSGDCSDLTCMQSGQCNLDLDLSANSVYYLTVAGDSRFKTSYQVEFRVYPRAPLTCFNAEHLYAGYYFTYYYYVDTTYGSILQDDPCGATGQAFWGQVYVPSVGVNVTLSTCGYWTNFDTVISVYSGSCGGGLSCVAINDNSPNYCQYDYVNSGTSEVSFLAADTSYYFTVTGAQGQTGQAEVLITAHEGAF